MARYIAGLIGLVIVGVVSGLMLSLIVTPIYRLFIRIFIAPYIGRQKLEEKAIRDGHVVRARLVKTWTAFDEPMKEYGVYEYTWNGKRYKCRLNSTSNLPAEQDLYFIRRPSKAVPSNWLGVSESKTGWKGWIKSYLFIALLIGLIFMGIGVYVLKTRGFW